VTFDHVVQAAVRSIAERFGPRGLVLVKMDRQYDDLYRIHYSWNGLDFHHVLDEQGSNVFVLELSEIVVLDEATHPGVIRAALAAMNRLHSRLHYVRCLLIPVDPEPSALVAVDCDVELARRAMGWLLEPLPDQSAHLTLNFEMPLLEPLAKQRLDAFDVAMTFLIEGAQMVLTDLHGSGFPVVPTPKAAA
jgi:hypothetical protein